FQVHEKRPHDGRQRRPGGRQAEGLAPLKQLHAPDVFEILQLMTDRALRDVQFLGGRGKGGVTGSDFKRAQGGGGWQISHRSGLDGHQRRCPKYDSTRGVIREERPFPADSQRLITTVVAPGLDRGRTRLEPESEIDRL
nr:hypothetical protein [Tanacetum cinerariifolium]